MSCGTLIRASAHRRNCGTATSKSCASGAHAVVRINGCQTDRTGRLAKGGRRSKCDAAMERELTADVPAVASSVSQLPLSPAAVLPAAVRRPCGGIDANVGEACLTFCARTPGSIPNFR
jgi:hypothetical protein